MRQVVVQIARVAASALLPDGDNGVAQRRVHAAKDLQIVRETLPNERMDQRRVLMPTVKG